MSARHSLSLLLSALLPALAFAQAPSNDLCVGAEVLTFGADGLATSSIIRNQGLAADAGEAPLNCVTNPNKTVWFTFTAPVTGTYGFDTCGTSTFSTVLGVYSGDCTSLSLIHPGACVSQNTSQTSCNPATRVSTSTLDAGAGVPLTLTAGTTYYVQVGASLAVNFTEASQLRLRVGYEAPPPNDTCNGTLPSLQVNDPMLVSWSAANLSSAMNEAQLPGDGGCLQSGGQIHTNTTAPGNDVVVRFTPPASGLYSLRASQPLTTAQNPVLYLTTSTCLGGSPMSPATYHGGAGGTCLAASNRGNSSGYSAAEELSCVPLSAGTDYNLWLDAQGVVPGGAFVVEAARCLPEAEGNDQPAAANLLQCPLTGNLFPVGDLDFFEVGRYPGARLFAMTEMTATTLGDTQLRVTTATDTLFFDEDDAPSLLGNQGSVVAGVVLPDAPVYLQTNYRNLNTATGPYRLHSMLKFGAPVAEREPNDTRAQAVDLGTFISGSLAAPAEVDIYKFDAREGDLVFVAMDNSPNRTGIAGADLNFEVFDALGWSARVANDTNTAVSNTSSPGTLMGTSPFAPADGYVFRANTTGTHYVHVTRVSVAGPLVGDYHLALSINCGMTQPTLSTVTPTSGTVLGGETITLSGANFDGSSKVTINGVAATVTSVTPTQLTVLTPGSNEGAADVTVTNFGGLSGTLPGGFTFIAPIAPPTISAVTPPFGAVSGGTVVTLTGSLFKQGAEVSFTSGGTTVQATLVNVVNATRLTCVVPGLPAGLATVTVRNPVDDLQGSLVNGFTFVPPPTFAGLTPSTGFIAGGAVITITGTGFLPGAIVNFGSVPGTGVVVAADGLSLTVVTPAMVSDGVVSITVRNADGQLVLVNDAFTYRHPTPGIITVSPSSGVSSGGEVITITGTEFLGSPAPEVRFGTTLARGVVRVSATQLNVLTPPGSGVVDVIVTNRDGQSTTQAQAFRFNPAPSVSTISPARGPVQGGTRLTITGQDFVAGARVTIGGVPAFAPSVVSSTTINVVTNMGVVGPADVRVQNPDNQFALVQGGFTYDAAPTLTSLTPGSGTLAGGTVVTLTGTGFRAGATVAFGVLPATAVNVVSPTELTATTPASALGVVTVHVTNDDGQTASLPRSFRFVANPTLTGVSPELGDVTGGTVVRLTGTHFTATTAVTFDGVPAQRVSFIDATTLEAVAPAHLPGAVEVRITNSNADTAALADAFTYTRAAPMVVSLAPASGLITGGAQVNITGSGFAPNVSVTFGGVVASAVVVASPSLLRVVAPPHAEGAVDLVVTNDDGQAATLPSGFRYVATTSDVNVVTDGGDGSLSTDAGISEPPPPSGCGCSSLEGSVLAFAALGLLLRRRR